MKRNNNEEGYTLILTLMITTIIILFFATFTVKAFSLQKQVNITDINYETTAITEMGVEFYQAHIINLIYQYSNLTKSMIEQYKQDVTKKNGMLPNNYETKINNIKNKQMNLLKGEIYNLSSSLSTSKNIQLDINSKKYFTILDNYDEKVKLFKTEFINDLLVIHVRGNNEDKFQVITAKFNFPKDLSLLDNFFVSGEDTSTINFPKCNNNYSFSSCIEDQNVILTHNLNHKTIIFNGVVTLETKKRIEFNNRSKILINKLVLVDNDNNNGKSNALKVKKSTLCIKDISEESAKRINSAASNVYILTEGNPSLNNSNAKSIENLKFVNKTDFNKNCTFENSTLSSSNGGFLAEVIYH